MEKLSIYGAIPGERYDSIQETIKRIAPGSPGIIFFWDNANVFWFVEEADDIEAHLTMIRTVQGHPRRQGVKFAFEAWDDSAERRKRLHFVIDHYNPSGQKPGTHN